MIHEDITISGSFQASGSFILPRIPSNSLATATTGSMFYDTVNDIVKIYTGTGSTTDGYITVGAQTAPAAAGGGGVSDDIEYLVIAGGSSGGRGSGRSGGGGGAGGYLSSSLSSIESGSQITVTVGAGGAVKTGADGQGNDGGDSTLVSAAGTSFTTVTALGGGGGGYPGVGRDGGSGGGGAHGGTSGGSGTVGQGNDGGDGSGESPYAGAGGGGAGTAGSNSSAGSAGTGGNGLASSITGTSITRAGGGGGGGSVDAAGGTGGGGHRATGTANPGGANTGGGGGGAQTTSGAGGSGVAILSYPTSSITAQGGIKTTRADGQFVHTFKESGTLTVGDSGSYIIAPSENFNIVTYTGNASTQAITGVGFQPDLIWIKGRNFADNHNIGDSSRGPANFIFPNLTSEEFTSNNYFTSFDSDGFTLGSDGTSNANGNTFVAWCWKAGLSASLSSTTSTDIYTAASDNCSDTGAYIIGTKTHDFTTPTYVKGAYSYSVYGASARASNITIQWSDDNSNWVTAYSTTMDNGDPVGCGIVNSGNYATETDANALKIGKHRYWRYVEGSAITGHHPRVSRIGFYVPNYTGVVNKNADAGFSIVPYTGDGGASSTVEHGLGVQPRLVIVKRLVGGYNWMVGYLNSSEEQHSLYFNTTAARDNELNRSPQGFNTTTFQLGSIANDHTNKSGDEYIAYCFANVEGYQKIGTYTGTGSAGHAITGLGFKPKYVMIKSATTAEDWLLFDSVRGNSIVLYPNKNDVEASFSTFVFDSNGFTIPQWGSINASGETYLYWAISE